MLPNYSASSLLFFPCLSSLLTFPLLQNILVIHFSWRCQNMSVVITSDWVTGSLCVCVCFKISSTFSWAIIRLMKTNKVQIQGQIKDLRSKAKEMQHKKPEPHPSEAHLHILMAVPADWSPLLEAAKCGISGAEHHQSIKCRLHNEDWLQQIFNIFCLSSLYSLTECFLSISRLNLPTCTAVCL